MPPQAIFEERDFRTRHGGVLVVAMVRKYMMATTLLEYPGGAMYWSTVAMSKS